MIHTHVVDDHKVTVANPQHGSISSPAVCALLPQSIAANDNLQAVSVVVLLCQCLH